MTALSFGIPGDGAFSQEAEMSGITKTGSL